MNANKPSSSTMLWLPAGVVLLAVGAWWWRGGVFRSQQTRLPAEAWEQVRQSYPLPHDIQETRTVSSRLAETVLQANPFSPKRREAPPSPDDEGAGDQGHAPILPAPQFVYKGHIHLGQRQRAIVEDTNSRKTHFLEVGQEVTGFKVLDISEHQVVLSDLQTNEEVVLSLTAKPRP